MIVKCASCQRQLKVDLKKYNQNMILVQCPHCNQKLRVKLSETVNEQPESMQEIIVSKPTASIVKSEKTPFKIRKWHFFIFGSIVILLAFSYYYSKKMYLNTPEKTVDRALHYLNKTSSDGTNLFESSYEFGVFKRYPHYRIYNWKLTSAPIDSETYIVGVVGETVGFVLRKSGKIWIIYDSYDFLAIDVINGIGEKSDVEKDIIMTDINTNVELNWRYDRHTRGYLRGLVEGTGIVVNNSKTSINSIKFVIEYENKSGNIVNKDETYINIGDELRPGQQKRFRWYTQDCYNCVSGKAHLKFD